MSFTAALITRRLIDGSKWAVDQAFFYGVGTKGSFIFALVYAGFVTDLASIPRILHWLIPKTGKHDQAAVVHDMGYRYGYIIIYRPKINSYELVFKDRKYWDDVFLEAMKVLGVTYSRRYTLYNGVRAFGFLAWNKRRKTNEIHPLMELYPSGFVPEAKWDTALADIDDRYRNRQR